MMGDILQFVACLSFKAIVGSVSEADFVVVVVVV